MVPIVSLWLPILASAVLVFVVSSIIHMVLKYHKNDVAPLPDEEPVRAALGKLKLPPGQYMVPACMSMKEMSSPEMVKKLNEGPVAFITMMPLGPFKVGKNLVQWFLLSIAIGIFVGYVLRPLPVDAPYLLRFRVAAAAAWAAYAGGVVWGGIWKGAPWRTVAKEVFDGLLYALVTAGAFAGFWPK